MNILHITPHMGGGVGTVIMGWLSKVNDTHEIACLDTINEKAMDWAEEKNVLISFNLPKTIWGLRNYIKEADIVLVHYWDHPMLANLFADSIPDCRLVFWCHKNITATMFNPVWWDQVLNYPDRFIATSPIITGTHEYIWSTGGVDRFLEIQPKKHEGFNVGYVGTVDWKKVRSSFLLMLHKIGLAIPDAHFTIIGEDHISDTIRSPWVLDKSRYNFTGHVDDIAPYLAEMDVFGYPLRPDHYGTSEQVLGEAMAAGVVPVVMDNPAERVIIDHRNSGLIASTEDKYIRFIKHLYDHRDTREIMSVSARKYAKDLYSLDTMIARWNKVFEEMMQEPKRARGTL